MSFENRHHNYHFDSARQILRRVLLQDCSLAGAPSGKFIGPPLSSVNHVHSEILGAPVCVQGVSPVAIGAAIPSLWRHIDITKNGLSLTGILNFLRAHNTELLESLVIRARRTTRGIYTRDGTSDV